MNIKGTIKTIGELQTFDSGFKKKELIIETGGEYPQLIKFEVIKDTITKLDAMVEGQEVDVHFNIRGREHDGRVFNNLQAWKFEF